VTRVSIDEKRQIQLPDHAQPGLHAKTVPKDRNWWGHEHVPNCHAGGRVSMNITTFATSLASSRLPDSLASLSFSGSQSREQCADDGAR
jgi:hypothetical protein